MYSLLGVRFMTTQFHGVDYSVHRGGLCEPTLAALTGPVPPSAVKSQVRLLGPPAAGPADLPTQVLASFVADGGELTWLVYTILGFVLYKCEFHGVWHWVVSSRAQAADDRALHAALHPPLAPLTAPLNPTITIPEYTRGRMRDVEQQIYRLLGVVYVYVEKIDCTVLVTSLEAVLARFEDAAGAV